MSDIRVNNIIIICGNRGTGKTDFLKAFIQNAKKNFDKIIITDVFKNPAWRNMKTWDNPNGIKETIQDIKPDKVKYLKRGIKHVWDSDADKLMDCIDKDVMDTLVVMEDGSKYFDTSMTKTQTKITLDTKQKNIDLVIAFHGVTFVPLKLIRIADFIYLKKSGDSPKVIADRLPTAPNALKIAQEIERSKDPYITKIIELN